MTKDERFTAKSIILDNVTCVNRFRHKIEDEMPEHDERAQSYFEDMCKAINNLINYANTL